MLRVAGHLPNRSGVVVEVGGLAANRWPWIANLASALALAAGEFAVPFVELNVGLCLSLRVRSGNVRRLAEGACRDYLSSPVACDDCLVGVHVVLVWLV